MAPPPHHQTHIHHHLHVPSASVSPYTTHHIHVQYHLHVHHQHHQHHQHRHIHQAGLLPLPPCPRPRSTAFQDEVMVFDAVADTQDVRREENRTRMSRNTIMGHLTTKAFKNLGDSLCAICLCEFDEDEKIGVLHCGHQFHRHCISNWLVQTNVCPMCRATALNIPEQQN